jgi:mannose-6-phosphate isomerase class I
VDPAELGRILRDSPFKPEILAPRAGESGGVWAAYPANCREFSLFTAKSEGETIDFSPQTPAIILITAGKALLETSGERESLALGQGESAFIAGGTDAKLMGAFTVYAATVGPAAAGAKQADTVEQVTPAPSAQA